MKFSSKPRLPKDLADGLKADFLTRADGKRPATELKDGSWLLLATIGLVQVSDTDAQFIGHWHEIQHAVWEAKHQMLIIRWVDPSREPWHGVTVEDDVRSFMSQLDEFIEYTIVTTSSRQAENGTLVHAAIRRTSDGRMFSTLTADGPLDEDGEQLADQLETSLRDAVGLEA
ncbi:MAG: hypothetical protein Q4E01_00935 [Actinomycetaceae bacterium]|nr:hypothetical protein [Actinomycetaceae bacterium]